jgi:hypothetical protein
MNKNKTETTKLEKLKLFKDYFRAVTLKFEINNYQKAN